MKAVFLDYATMGSGLNLEPLSRFFSAFEVFEETDDDQVAERIHNVEFVFTNKFRMTPPLLEAATALQFIGLTATGTDNIDLDAARSHGIAVSNIRAYCTHSVVEHVFGVMLMLAHSLGLYNDAVRAGEWQKSASFCLLAHPIRGLAGKTLGVVGYGELGKAVANVAGAFGMQVLVSARPGTRDVGADRVTFDELLERADFISLHCPLTDDTRSLLAADQFRQMKSTAFVINTARGALIDSAALVEALQSGAIAGAAVDVLAKEPPRDDDPVVGYQGDNLIVTPHIAWATDEARQNAIDELAANVEAFLNGEERNRVV
jgi:glycerate dehydrogenase